MNKIIIYRKDNCGLCEEVEVLVDLLKMDSEIEFEKVDIMGNILLERKYLLEIPVLVVNGYELDYRRINLDSIRERLH
ncbi:glutaredoxin family protein [Halobacillus sp. A1]|uniref:glutaredoxin family protein n=1 Tax=Halobacillus sp. A1 TaxID=2880262 RepID=UPI0020A6B74F|nr:glutaredoxin family protein [Halobacillus sp. A1]MCP3031364.1 glutaredoxin family protein [Halobacillus sp. A1]